MVSQTLGELGGRDAGDLSMSPVLVRTYHIHSGNIVLVAGVKARTTRIRAIESVEARMQNLMITDSDSKLVVSVEFIFNITPFKHISCRMFQNLQI